MKPIKLAAAASTAAVAAAAAYAVGTQQSDGSAQAAGTSRSVAATQAAAAATSTPSATAGRPWERGLAGAADALGVSPSALRTALEELRDEQAPRTGLPDIAASLARALGKTEAEVSSALDAVRRDGGDRGHRGAGGLASALAAELDVSAERVRAALTEAHEAGHAEWRREQAAALARELGMDAARVAAALEEVAPDPGDPGQRRAWTDVTEALARELGIEEDRVDEAFDALGEARAAERDTRVRELADQLAEKLDIPRERVRDLARDFGLLGGGGPGGRGGAPGGPGFPWGGHP